MLIFYGTHRSARSSLFCGARWPDPVLRLLLLLLLINGPSHLPKTSWTNRSHYVFSTHCFSQLNDIQKKESSTKKHTQKKKKWFLFNSQYGMAVSGSLFDHAKIDHESASACAGAGKKIMFCSKYSSTTLKNTTKYTVLLSYSLHADNLIIQLAY